MAKNKKKAEEIDDLSAMDFYQEEFEDDFWGDLEGDIVAAQKKAVELLTNPKGLSRYTLTDLSGSEIKAIATLKSISELIPDPILVNFIRNYVVLKRSHKRKGVKELISIVGGRAWKLLQNITLPRVRREHEEEI